MYIGVLSLPFQRKVIGCMPQRSFQRKQQQHTVHEVRDIRIWYCIVKT